jgi:cell division protein FtsL
MLKKIRIGRVLLLIVVVVIANLYFGCVNKYYPPDYQTKEGAKIQQQDEQIKAMQKEIEELKKQK